MKYETQLDTEWIMRDVQYIYVGENFIKNKA